MFRCGTKSSIALKHLLFASIILSLTILSTSTHAESDNGSMVFSVNVASTPTIQITLPSAAISLNLRPDPNADTAFGATGYNVEVGTSSPAGYTLSMTTNSTTLTNSATTPNPTIETLADNGTTGYTESSFTTNAWGYKPTSVSDNTINYFAMKSSVQVDNYNTATNSRITNLTFASKVDSTKSAGSYTTTLNFVAVATPVEYIQNLDPNSCITTAPTTVYDTRDYESYEIQRLADGRCWMLDNLRLGSAITMRLNSEDTNIARGTSFTLPASTSGVWGTYIDPKINIDVKDNLLSYGNGSGKTGVYYNYCAASAGSICIPKGENYANASYDICPAGWRMPTGGSSGEYQQIAEAITGITGSIDDATKYADFMNSLHIVLAGRYSDNGDSGATGINSHVSIWSATYATTGSTAHNGNTMGRLFINSTAINPSAVYYRNTGFPIRCVINAPVISDITTMQQFSTLSEREKANVKASMGANITYQLTDTRDSKPYNVAKLADGKIWMTSNLNLAGGTTLSSDKSDVPSTNYYTLPASTAITSGTSVSSDQFSSDTGQYVFNTNNETSSQADCAELRPCNSYYSWLVATAGGKDASDNNVTANGADAAYSICPKGWRLPTSGNQTAGDSNNWKKGDFYALATAYGASLESQHSEEPSNFYSNAGPGTLPNFLITGRYRSGGVFTWGVGNYWSATSGSTTGGRYLYFRSGRVESATNNGRGNGFPVRCILR